MAVILSLFVGCTSEKKEAKLDAERRLIEQQEIQNVTKELIGTWIKVDDDVKLMFFKDDNYSVIIDGKKQHTGSWVVDMFQPTEKGQKGYHMWLSDTEYLIFFFDHKLHLFPPNSADPAAQYYKEGS